MPDILKYIIGLIVCNGTFYLLYKLLLEGNVGHNTARAYLILSVIASAVIPALNIAVYPGEVIAVPAVSYAAELDLETITTVEALPKKDTLHIILCLSYTTIVFVLLGFTVYGINRILRYKQGANIKRERYYTLVESPKVKSPFSFFKSIFLSPQLKNQDREQVITHEASHIKHRHSIDIILLEFFKSFLWFNPFIWFTRRSVTEVHEYQADREVIETGYDLYEYKSLIFRQQFGCNPDMANGMSSPLIKKRLTMMLKNKPGKYALLKTFAALPVIAGLMLMFSFTSHDTVYTTEEPASTALEQVELAAFNIATNENGTFEVTIPETGLKGTATGISVNIDENTLLSINSSDLKLSNIKEIASATIHVSDNKGHDQQAETINEEPIETFFMSKSSDSDKTPLIIIDGKESSDKTLNAIDPNSIESISVLKEKAGISTYGDKAKDGVIIVKLKSDQENNPNKTEDVKIIGYATQKKTSLDEYDMNNTKFQVAGYVSSPKSYDGKNPLIIIDGQESTSEDLNALDSKDIQSISVLKDTGTAQYGDKAKDGVILITTKNQTPDNVTINAETMPTFQNGDIHTFRNWVMSNIIYPEEAVKNDIEGKVVVSFVIEKDGSLTDIKIEESPHDLLGNEIKRVLKQSPKWTPGMDEGKPVRVPYNMPIEFNLSKKDNDSDKDKRVLVNSDAMPTFQGGDIHTFRNWVMTNMTYPEEAVKNDIQGRVTASFVIEKDGSLTDIEIEESPHDLLGNEIKRVLKQSPKWTPGINNGKPTRVQYSIPIDFNVTK